MVELLDFLLRFTSVITLVLLGLGFFFREKIKQMLSRSLMIDIEKVKKDLNKELAEHTSKLQHELEAYKVLLMADIERVKAEQDVKKSLALRMAEKRFNAVSEALDVCLGMSVIVAAHLSKKLDFDSDFVAAAYDKETMELLDKINLYSKAKHGVSIFLLPDENQLIIDFQMHAVQLLSLRPRYSDPVILDSDERVSILFKKAFAVETMLVGMLREMEYLS